MSTWLNPTLSRATLRRPDGSVADAGISTALTMPTVVPFLFSWKSRRLGWCEALAGRCTYGAPMDIAVHGAVAEHMANRTLPSALLRLREALARHCR